MKSAEEELKSIIAAFDYREVVVSFTPDGKIQVSGAMTVDRTMHRTGTGDTFEQAVDDLYHAVVKEGIRRIKMDHRI